MRPSDQRGILLRPDAVWDAIASAPVSGLDVLLRDHRVVEIAPDLAPGDAEVVDLPGCTVMPGFIDCHVHLLDEGAEMSSAAYQTLTGIRPLRQLLANGFTTVRDLGSAHQALNVALRQAVEDGLIVGPRVLAAPNILSPRSGHGDKSPDLAQRYGTRIGALADGIEEVRRAVRDQAQAGADWIKFAGGGGFSSPVSQPTSTAYSQAEMDALVATADDMLLPCATHALHDEAVVRAVRAGVRSVEHACLATDPTYELMTDAGTYLVPTQYVQRYFVDNLDDDDFWSERPAHAREAYRVHAARLREGLLRPARTRVKVAFGTDAGMFPHADNWREFPAMLSHGFTALRALRAATTVAADLLDRGDLGRLAPGSTADVIALHGDPFVDIQATGRVRYVVKDGRSYPPGSLA
ncbi:hypothetical protein B4N89_40935 [Embleya scabrispora]|uniref:Amidohydrolase-related domain-containing protein n=1 Tax=Embleya scabrispora TaxID=159449 RepID=A0A1T3NJE8_9ACTN|nr:amidohydrolase family protein [Embleya scabrispora]OPC76959.1 hypothetical protein B4N89_40935 [Embleya scabrispora]